MRQREERREREKVEGRELIDPDRNGVGTERRKRRAVRVGGETDFGARESVTLRASMVYAVQILGVL